MRKLVAAVAAVVGLAFAPAALANTYKPTKTGDHAPNGCNHSDCTLREAVIKANGHNGPDRIVLRAGKVYRRSSLGTGEDASADGDLDTHGRLKIETPKFVRTHGHRHKATPATIDGNDNERVLDAFSSLTLLRVRVRNGLASASDQGGGVRTNAGSLRVLHSRVASNEAEFGGGILSDNPGKQTIISRSSIRNNQTAFDGAGIYVDGTSTVSLRRSRVAGNIGVDGGGIYNENQLNLRRSTISGNRSQGGNGGAIYTEAGVVTVKSTLANNRTTGDGGGVYTAYNTATLKVTGSTLSGNSAEGGAGGGGGIYSSGDLRLTNDTIAGNSAVFGGGLYYDGSTAHLNAVTIARNQATNSGGGTVAHFGAPAGSFHIDNSIVAKNSAPSFPDCSNAVGVVDSGGHNLFGVSNACQGTVGDREDINAKIGLLRNNGGPTKTIALRRGSPAINHAGASAPGRDQRGHRRHNPDIGAFER